MYELPNNFTGVIKFYLPRCGPCKMLNAGAWPRLIEANPDITFLDCDTGKSPNQAKQNKIEAVPTVVFFKNGLEVWRVSGGQQQDKYQEAIDLKLKAS